MKKIGVILIMLASIFTSGISQNVNQKLLVKHDKMSLEKIQRENPVEYEYLNMYVTESCFFVEMPNKTIDYLELKKINVETGEVIEGYVITERDLENFNPYEWNVQPLPDRNSYYKAGNTGKLLIVSSDFDIRNEAGNRVRVRNFNK